jgi:hypothetical protein
MARHLLIGNNVAAVADAEVVANKAIDVQKRSIGAGAISVTAGDTNVTAPEIRFVQGTASGNRYSPWITVANVIDFTGKSAVAQSAHVATATLSTNADGAGTHILKVMNLTNGAEPFEMKTYEITVAAAATPTTQSAALTTALNADLPHWVNTVTDGTGNVVLTGWTKGAAKRDGSVAEDLVQIDAAWEGEGTTMAVTSTGNLRGYGSGPYIQAFEESLQGIGSGYYNRISRPIAPTATAVAGTDYDMYRIVATKDGSTTSGINGVDNLIEVNIAFDPALTAGTTALEAQLDGLFGNFPAVTL